MIGRPRGRSGRHRGRPGRRLHRSRWLDRLGRGGRRRLRGGRSGGCGVGRSRWWDRRRVGRLRTGHGRLGCRRGRCGCLDRARPGRRYRGARRRRYRLWPRRWFNGWRRRRFERSGGRCSWDIDRSGGCRGGGGLRHGGIHGRVPFRFAGHIVLGGIISGSAQYCQSEDNDRQDRRVPAGAGGRRAQGGHTGVGKRRRGRRVQFGRGSRWGWGRWRRCRKSGATISAEGCAGRYRRAAVRAQSSVRCGDGRKGNVGRRQSVAALLTERRFVPVDGAAARTSCHGDPRYRTSRYRKTTIWRNGKGAVRELSCGRAERATIEIVRPARSPTGTGA